MTGLPRDPGLGVLGAAPRSRGKLALGGAIIVAVVAVAVTIVVAAISDGGSISRLDPGPGSSAQAGGSPSPSAIPGATGAPLPGLFVHVLGAVSRPGLYLLGSNSRAVDAIAAAGGFTPDAEQGSVNLARILSDGEQLVVSRVGEGPPAGADAGGGAGGGGGSTSGSSGGASAGSGSSGGSAGVKVNLNTADVAALDSLPGIGPTTAGKILDWRTDNGRFTSIEDLLSVPGIGDKTFADLRDLVTV